ncbi:hypothetical protein ACOMHN_035180 [Nucella lapillus]
MDPWVTIALPPDYVLMVSSLYISLCAGMESDLSSIECTFRGAQLASFNTAEELHSVTDVMWRNRPIAVKVGLYMPSARLPSM